MTSDCTTASIKNHKIIRFTWSQILPDIQIHSDNETRHLIHPSLCSSERCSTFDHMHISNK